MKLKTLHVCEYCGKVYFEQADCEECEALHLGLTRREYLDWRILHKTAAKAGEVMGCRNDETTRNNFYTAVENLTMFEEKHGIKSDCKKPTDFYY